MGKGIIEKVVSSEIGQYGLNVFKNSEISLALGNSNNYTGVKIRLLGINGFDKRSFDVFVYGEPICKKWLEKGFEFLKSAGGDDMDTIILHDVPLINVEKIKPELKYCDIKCDKGHMDIYGINANSLEFLDSFGKHYFNEKFENAWIQRYNRADNMSPSITIQKKRLQIRGGATNKAIINYAKCLDNFLK